MHGLLDRTVYLSEAVWSVPIEKGYINLVEAPMGSGKNHFAKNFTGTTLLLVPTKALVCEAVNKGFTEIRENEFIPHWAKWLFGGETTSATHYVCTIQHFQRHLPDIHHCTKLDNIFIDECDLALVKMPTWKTNGKSTADSLYNWLTKAATMKTCVCMSATGMDNVAAILSHLSNVRMCKTKSKLRTYTRVYAYYLSPILHIDYLVKNNYPVAIYGQKVRQLISIRKHTNNLANSAILVSDSATHYIRLLIDTVTIMSWMEEKFGDTMAVYYNDAFNRGINIKDGKCMDVVILPGSDADEITQAHGRFRYDGVRVWLPVKTEWIEDNMEYCKNKAIVETYGQIRTKTNWLAVLGMQGCTADSLAPAVGRYGLALVQKGRRYMLKMSDEEMTAYSKSPEIQKFLGIGIAKTLEWYKEMEEEEVENINIDTAKLYTAEELKILFKVDSLDKINKYELKIKRPRIDGKQVRRYQLVSKLL